MNNLQHIRSMAEMILKQVDELENKPAAVQHSFQEFKAEHHTPCPKFKIGDRVQTRSGTQGIVTAVYYDCGGHCYDVQYVESKCPISGCYLESELYKVEVKPKFKVGDKVVWLSDTEEKVLTVVGVGHDQFNMDAHAAGRVTFPNETGVYFQYDVTSERGGISTFGEAALKPYVEPNADELIWHSGPPPHVGWWNASRGKADYAWRWWNGEYWSISVSTTDDAELAAQCALHGEPIHHEQIQWTDYWPENARVPRIVPDVHLAKNNYKAYYHWHDTNTFEIWHLDPVTGNVTKV